MDSQRNILYFLTIFNRMSGSADEMGTFVNDLVADIKWKELQLEAKQKEQDEHLQKIEDLAQELSNERTENKSKESNVSKLKLEIANLRKNSISIPDISLSKSRLAEIEKMTSVTRDALKYSDIAKLNSRQMDALKISDMGKFSSAYDEIMSNEKFAKQLKLSESLLEKYRSQVSIGTKVNKKVRKPKDEN